ncbi:redox-sensing transcriptional repressor Rex [candidate division LCP-89 bacterium B3_LCP]|uniref:Redox-sensing transcriptional repressor Rex n=1 Tax=candidate division LCP-89 bacterium B3_LCP TaxID=2012998 RepID=A0A532V4I5_UNCL8|nr:MAG: redox-sensing transcriptional repressor Rex [candidate division LCP-89 bacterium B3_LCP]
MSTPISGSGAERFNQKISDATVGRLSRYYRTLKHLEADNVQTVSSDELAKRNNSTPAQVRKDFSFFGAFGRRGLGYNVLNLKDNIMRILGLDQEWHLALVGVGNIGRALIHFKQFEEQNFHFTLLLDSDPKLIGTKISGLEVKNLDNLSEEIRKGHVDIAVIAVPVDAAQKVANALVETGVKAILNFAPITLMVSEDVSVRNENMVIEIERLSFALANV